MGYKKMRVEGYLKIPVTAEVYIDEEAGENEWDAMSFAHDLITEELGQTYGFGEKAESAHPEMEALTETFEVETEYELSLSRGEEVE